PRRVRLMGDYNLVRGSMVFKIPGLASAQAPALDMLGSILGQGTSAILFQKLREELGIVHDIDASTWNPIDPGLFWISYACEPGSETAAEAAIWEVLRAVQFSPLPKEFLDKARRRASVGEINLRSTMSGQASRLGLSEVVVGDLAYPHEYFKALARLTPEGLQAIAERYFQNTSLSQVTLGPTPPEAKNVGLITQKALPDFEEVTFANGARLLLQPWQAFPKVHVRMVGHGGPMYENAAERGLTNLMACLLTKDTARRSAKEVAEAIEAVGGGFNEVAGNNSFGVGVEVLPTDLPLGLELLHDALGSPKFLESTLKREREGQVAALQEDEDDIVSFGVRRLRKLFFGDHPYADDTLGRIDTVKMLGVDAVRSHFARLMTASNAVFAVSGAFEREAILETLGPIIEALPPSTFALPELPFAGPAAVGEHRVALDREQTVVFDAYMGCGIVSDDFHASEVMDELLSGLSSRLFMRVREERSLAYFVGANRMLGLNAGMFYLYAGTQADAVPVVLQEMHAELERIKRGEVAPDELARVRTHLKAQKRMALQTIGSRASNAALNGLYGLQINEWRDYDRKIDAVTTESLVTFVSKYLRPESRVQLIVEPKK
ncbi:MAG TPA: insulinase family protein, partial [Opitutales bacterium]|nr:insulinase family protein [Opitutales bacterium]